MCTFLDNGDIKPCPAAQHTIHYLNPLNGERYMLVRTTPLADKANTPTK